jgi:nitrile hydratase subunit beta
MDGIHDLGGMQGFGPIEPTASEPPFGEAWEGRTHGLLLSLMSSGAFPPGSFRHAIERMDPVHYLTSGYYEHWLAAIDTLVRELGHAGPEEIEEWMQRVQAGEPVPQRSDPGRTELIRTLMASYRDAAQRPGAGAFVPGDRLRVRNASHGGHTRCPRYVRGRCGTVERVHADAPLPDAQASGGTDREVFYTVAFDARELWQDAEPGHVVYVDLWESYLEPEDRGA